jgi:hypothetical protein
VPAGSHEVSTLAIGLSTVSAIGRFQHSTGSDTDVGAFGSVVHPVYDASFCRLRHICLPRHGPLADIRDSARFATSFSGHRSLCKCHCGTHLPLANSKASEQGDQTLRTTRQHGNLAVRKTPQASLRPERTRQTVRTKSRNRADPQKMARRSTHSTAGSQNGTLEPAVFVTRVSRPHHLSTRFTGIALTCRLTRRLQADAYRRFKL